MYDSIVFKTRSLWLFKSGYGSNTQFVWLFSSDIQVLRFLKSNTTFVFPIPISKCHTSISVWYISDTDTTHFEMSVLHSSPLMAFFLICNYPLSATHSNPSTIKNHLVDDGTTNKKATWAPKMITVRIPLFYLVSGH